MRGKPVVIDGVEYPSYSAAGRALGRAPYSIQYMVEHGKCTAKGKGSRWTQPVVLDDKEFWNITDISKYCGCSWYKASLIAHEYFAKIS